MNPELIINTVRTLVDLILSLVPHDVARLALDDAAVRRANAIANAAEAVKFGPKP